jgi:hypothetical protein
MTAHPEYTKELVHLLEEDQKEKREAGRAYFTAAPETFAAKQAELAEHSRRRAERALHILGKIGEPSLSRIGTEGARALSVIAVHASADAARQILAAFTKCYERDPADTHLEAIPSLTDWVHIMERKPQRFGTIWLFDKRKQPYLPTVADFEHVNERRAAYGIGPLRWPKSLAIPESEQPWLKRPLSELVMRDPTDQEYGDLLKDMP